MRCNLLKQGLVIIALAALAGCSYPSSRTEISDERPSIALSGALKGSVVFVDGLEMGPATKFDGRNNVLMLEPGNHVIRILLGNDVLLTERIFLSGQATRTLLVR